MSKVTKMETFSHESAYKRDSSLSREPEVRVLFDLIVSQGRVCPDLTALRKLGDGKEFIRIAILNKATHLLSHLTSCPRCSRLTLHIAKYLRDVDMQLIYQKLFIKKEFALLKKHAKALKITYLLFKKTSRGSDIDILVKPKDLSSLLSVYKKIGYRTHHYPPKEVTLVNPKTSTPAIDLHTLLAYPHAGTLPQRRLQDVKSMTQDAWTFSNKHELSDEFYLVSSVFRFWYNDWGFGMQNLYEIVDFIVRKYNALNTNELNQLIDDYHMRRAFSFIVLLGFTYYRKKVPAKIYKLINQKIILFLLPYISTRLIIARHSFSQWKLNSKIIRSLYNDIFITDLFLDEKISIFRLFRPKIIIYCTRCVAALVK